MYFISMECFLWNLLRTHTHTHAYVLKGKIPIGADTQSPNSDKILNANKWIEWNGMKWRGIEVRLQLKHKHHLRIKCGAIERSCKSDFEDFELNSKAYRPINKNSYFSCIFSFIHDFWINHEAQSVWFAVQPGLFSESENRERKTAARNAHLIKTSTTKKISQWRTASDHFHFSMKISVSSIACDLCVAQSWRCRTHKQKKIIIYTVKHFERKKNEMIGHRPSYQLRSHNGRSMNKRNARISRQNCGHEMIFR